MHYYPVDYVPSDTSNKSWNALGLCSIYYTGEGRFAQQPTPYGQLINLPASQDVESMQLWLAQSTGDLYSRGGNSFIPLDETPFRRFITEKEVDSKLEQYATTADVAEAEKVESQGADWIRYKSGLQLCWVQYVGAASWWSFPVAFSSTPTVVFTGTTRAWPWISDITTTGCNYKSDGPGNGFAVGRWK